MVACSCISQIPTFLGYNLFNSVHLFFTQNHVKAHSSRYVAQGNSPCNTIALQVARKIVLCDTPCLPSVEAASTFYNATW